MYFLLIPVLVLVLIAPYGLFSLTAAACFYAGITLYMGTFQLTTFLVLLALASGFGIIFLFGLLSNKLKLL